MIPATADQAPNALRLNLAGGGTITIRVMDIANVTILAGVNCGLTTGRCGDIQRWQVTQEAAEQASQAIMQESF